MESVRGRANPALRTGAAEAKNAQGIGRVRGANSERTGAEETKNAKGMGSVRGVCIPYAQAQRRPRTLRVWAA
ncbi:hypothetical protein Cagg_3819 [Chloroflexus aggregans DSM 9485]|uniref:Uncharacterized protein n=1 Tax=Chloroflexus aggregans (strain MD-66 / DSM 9485) TaxID=326427 RepID=B8GB55_CHLAD|nr:hypothetical protein Cagg_3819 [Chloroflexus aggregans DSM 9485]